MATSALRSGNILSCGCLISEAGKKRWLQTEMVGKIFGKLTVQAEAVLDFLCDFLKFDPKKRQQDVNAIRRHVPKEYLDEFNRGVEAALGESLIA